MGRHRVPLDRCRRDTGQRHHVWSIGEAGGEYYAPSKARFMMNYRVHDLQALLRVLREEGCPVLDTTDDSEYG